MPLFDSKGGRGRRRWGWPRPPNTAGVEGIPIVFLFADNQIVSESFLEDINNILNTGKQAAAVVSSTTSHARIPP